MEGKVSRTLFLRWERPNLIFRSFSVHESRRDLTPSAPASPPPPYNRREANYSCQRRITPARAWGRITPGPRIVREAQTAPARQPRGLAGAVGWAWAWAGAETHYIIIITSHGNIQSPTQLFSTAHARAAVLVPAVGSLVVVSAEHRPSARAALACANRVGLHGFSPVACVGLEQ